MRMLGFRIQNFRSIKDTGVCTIAGDNVTILAGQNEAGKSAILMALRDFDLPEGKPPQTPDYMPEGDHQAEPSVSVEFDIDPDAINVLLMESKLVLPDAVLSHLQAKRKIWVTRYLNSGTLVPDEDVTRVWATAEAPNQTAQSLVPNYADLSLADFAKLFRQYWPMFVFFDSFQDQLPKEIAVESLHQHMVAKDAGQPLPPPQRGQSSVIDFLTLADIDLSLVIKLKDQDKALGNYLSGRTAAITGDFLTYWKQAVDGNQTVRLQVKHTRNAQGLLHFSFYVHDGVDQYPEQRSKGFAWFLSFYLRLAAEEKRNPGGARVLLIDEPGTYLHAKAQKDVLHLIEDKLATKQQVIYSTHSPYLLPIDKLHRLRIVLRHGQKGTIAVDRLTHPALRGDQFADTLSPVITAIGLDVRERITAIGKKNLLVEGLSDHIYLSTWASGNSSFEGQFCIFPGSGAGSLPTLASLCIGWGLDFSVLLDRDKEGEKTAKKFEREFRLEPKRILHPNNAVTIEDLFVAEDFQKLLTDLDKNLKMENGETPSQAVSRLGIDKILLARKFAENPKPYTKSQPAFHRLLADAAKSFN